jgi:rare lipoprotein A
MPRSRLALHRSLWPLAALTVLVGAGCAARHPSSSAAEPAPQFDSSPSAASATNEPRSDPLVGHDAAAAAFAEQGVASWYGLPFHGRRAANGEIYDMYKLTAAHRTLPFDTVVRVTNLSNGLHADVRIIDRGPFVEDRVIDLSLAAARALGMEATGTALVKLEVIASGAPLEGTFAVQVGAFSERDNAERLKLRLAPRYGTVSIQDYDAPAGRLYRVRVGSEPSVAAAQQLASRLASAEGFPTFVVRLDPSATRP